MSPPERSQARVEVEFSEQSGLPHWERPLMRKLVQSIVRTEAAVGHFALSLHLVDDETMCQLNRAQRGIDATTDVLSFPLQDPAGLRFVLPPETPIHLGDVVVSYPRAQVQAADYGHPLRRELAYLVAHGTLHLLGYDHEREEEQEAMRAREEAALSALGITR